MTSAMQVQGKSQREAAVAQEGEREVRVGADPVDAGVGGPGGLIDAVSAQVA